MTIFDRKTYFDSVRASLFSGGLSQQQTDGQNFILNAWEQYCSQSDTRWLGYFLATAYHETSQAMWPVEEYGKGHGMAYGVPDPQTGQTYYGRGFVQLTWRDNYQRADDAFGLVGDASCVYHAGHQLDPTISARTGYRGMTDGWFRGAQFSDYFNDGNDDPYNARDIINGDKTIIPDWSNGVSIGNLIKSYYLSFQAALNSAAVSGSIHMDLDAILATHSRQLQELRTALFGEHREAVTDLAAAVAGGGGGAEFEQRVHQALEELGARLAAVEAEIAKLAASPAAGNHHTRSR